MCQEEYPPPDYLQSNHPLTSLTPSWRQWQNLAERGENAKTILHPGGAQFPSFQIPAGMTRWRSVLSLSRSRTHRDHSRMLRLVTSAAAPLQGSTYLDLPGCMRAHSAAVKDSDQVRSETGNTSKRNQIRPVSLGTRAVRETRRPAKEDDRSVKSSLPRRPCDVGALGRQYYSRGMRGRRRLTHAKSSCRGQLFDVLFSARSRPSEIPRGRTLPEGFRSMLPVDQLQYL